MEIIANIWFNIRTLVAFIPIVLGSLIFKKWGSKKVQPEADINGQAVVVTGASRGMGKGMALELAKRGAIVIMGCIEIEEGERAKQEIIETTGNQNVEMWYVDMGDMDSVEQFGKKLRAKFPRIKLLLNNAGIVPNSINCNAKTMDGFNVIIAVHTLGHFLLTNLLEESLKRCTPSRVVTMISTGALFHAVDLDDIHMKKRKYFGPSGILSYCNAKFLSALIVRASGKRYKGSGITTYGLCPGVVNTQMLNKDGPQSALFLQLLNFLRPLMGVLSVEEACQGILHCAVSKARSRETGRLYRFKSHFTGVEKMITDDLAEKAWDVCAQAVNLKDRNQK